MQWPEPCYFEVDVESGFMQGTGSHYKKRLRDLEGLYQDTAAFKGMVQRHGDDIVYEVTDHRPSSDNGDIITGVTRMSPGQVGKEYFMTRGHLHALSDRPELYYGLKGTGLMLLESPDGETKTLTVMPNSACYVPPFWIHRSINIGKDDLVMLFCYPADSGQDYQIIERSNGMRQRIVEDGNGDWTYQENLEYRARTKQDVELLLDQVKNVKGILS
jgi:glucose-6-phosphate isomerase